MIKIPKNKKIKKNYLHSVEWMFKNKNCRNVEINITRNNPLKAKDLRAMATWMLDAADWLEDKDTNSFISINTFKKIVSDPIRVLLESLRYEKDATTLDEIGSKIEELITDSMNADEYTELNVFGHLNNALDEETCSWREDSINEIIDRINNPIPENPLIEARRLLYDYLNLPDDSLGILEEACCSLKTKKDKKMIKDYIEMWNNDEKPDVGGLGDIVHNLYIKYPLKTWE